MIKHFPIISLPNVSLTIENAAWLILCTPHRNRSDESPAKMLSGRFRTVTESSLYPQSENDGQSDGQVHQTTRRAARIQYAPFTGSLENNACGRRKQRVSTTSGEPDRGGSCTGDVLHPNSTKTIPTEGCAVTVGENPPTIPATIARHLAADQ